MTTYEDVRHADLEWQRQMQAVEVARHALIDATEAERLAYLASVRQRVELGDEADRPEMLVDDSGRMVQP